VRVPRPSAAGTGTLGVGAGGGRGEQQRTTFEGEGSLGPPPSRISRFLSTATVSEAGVLFLSEPAALQFPRLACWDLD
jgi:hypothetical protein